MTAHAGENGDHAGHAQSGHKRIWLDSDGLHMDLGDAIGTRAWWRGALTLAGLSIGIFALAAAARPTPISALIPQSGPAEDHSSVAIAPLSHAPAFHAGLPANARVRALSMPLEPASVTKTVEVQRNESLERALRRAGVARDEAAALAQTAQASLGDVKLDGGTDLQLVFGRAPAGDAPRPLEALEYRASFEEKVQAQRLGSQFLVHAQPIAIYDATARIEGTVGSSLYVAARRAGVPARIVNDYIKALSFGVDFQRDVVAKDRFALVFERDVAATGEVRHGKLLYASLELNKRDKTLELARFAPGGGEAEFFHADGVTVKRMLMRTPVDGRFRKSSGFGPRRHPILGYTRMHKGVDFAAPTGTPVLAAGAGRITFIGRNRGYGNFIKIDHGSGYSTAYAHLHRFSSGLKQGSRVEQGQVIAQVGSTGMSTGPHLHYEVHKNGEAINPNSKSLPVGRWLKGGELVAFKAELERLRAIRPNVSAAEVLAEASDGADRS